MDLRSFFLYSDFKLISLQSTVHVLHRFGMQDSIFGAYFDKDPSDARDVDYTSYATAYLTSAPH